MKIRLIPLPPCSEPTKGRGPRTMVTEDYFRSGPCSRGHRPALARTRPRAYPGRPRHRGARVIDPLLGAPGGRAGSRPLGCPVPEFWRRIGFSETTSSPCPGPPRESSLGPPARVGPVGVVVVQVPVQVESEAGVLGDEVAGERGLPAHLEDGLLDPLHHAVGLGAPGPDEQVAGPELGHRPLELGGAEL